VQALDDVSLTIERGEVVGIAGPNGAGKSTLLSLLLGYLKPSAGLATIDGTAPRAWVERHGIAYRPELLAIPGRWTVTSALRRYGTLDGLRTADARGRIGRVLEGLGLEEYRARQVRKLSKGNLQRLGLAQAMLAEREVMILDEPTHGLDPLWTQHFRDIVRDLRRPDRAIVIAAHNLDELERVADRVAILHRGRLQRVVEARDHEESGAWRLVIRAPHPALAAVVGAEPVPEARGVEFRITGDLATLNATLVRLIGEGVAVTAFYPEEGRLEAAFRRAVGESL
jgi:ABC-type multidrug transport system ATPase subunit